MCDNNGDPFIATLYNVLLAADLCDKLFSIITLINSGYTCLFRKWFCTVYFGAKDKNACFLCALCGHVTAFLSFAPK